MGGEEFFELRGGGLEAVGGGRGGGGGGGWDGEGGELPFGVCPVGLDVLASE